MLRRNQNRLLEGDVSIRDTAFFVMGMSLLWLFMRRSYYGVALSGAPDADASYMVLLASATVATVLLVAMRGKCTSLIAEQPRVFAIAGGAISLALVLLHGMMAAVGSPAMSFISACLLGVAFPVLTVMWGQAALSFGSRNRVLVLVAIAAAFLVGIAISTAAVVMGSAAPVLFLCFPAVSSLCWIACFRRQAGRSAKFDRLRRLPLVRVLVPAGFLLLTSGLRGLYYAGSISYQPGWDSLMPSLLSCFVGALLLGLLVCCSGPRQAFRGALIVFALLLLVGLLFATYGKVTQGTRSLIMVGRSCFDLFLFLVLVDSARGLRVSPITLFGVLFLPWEIASSLLSYFICPALVSAMGWSFSEAIPLVALATTLIFVAGSFLYFISDNAPERPLPTASDDAGRLTSLQARLQLLDGYADLTPREQEIALLLAQGNSYKRIAEMLVVSLSTVQTHARALYRKLSIHSKQELVNHLTEEGALPDPDDSVA